MDLKIPKQRKNAFQKCPFLEVYCTGILPNENSSFLITRNTLNNQYHKQNVCYQFLAITSIIQMKHEWGPHEA